MYAFGDMRPPHRLNLEKLPKAHCDPTGPDDEPKPTSHEDLFTVARQAAEDRQPDRMIEALAASGFLDGLVRRLDAKWGQLPRWTSKTPSPRLLKKSAIGGR